MATVVLLPDAINDIRDLPEPIIARMDGLIARLSNWPDVSGVKRLKGDLAGKFRLRTGDYRLQFRIEQTRSIVKRRKVMKGREVEEEKAVVNYKVIVEKAGHRDSFYGE